MMLLCELYQVEDKLGLDIKRDSIHNNYKVSFIGYGKYYKAPMKFTANSIFEKRIETISKGINKMLSEIKVPFDIIDAQIIYRPAFGKAASSLAAKVAIRFEKEEDWFDFRNKHRENLWRGE